MKNIFIAGSIAYDEIMDFPHHFKNYFHPEKLHQINVSFVVTDLAKHLGGIATNISFALKNTVQFYGSNTGLYPVGTIGKDGKTFIEFFKKNKINVRNIIEDKTLYTATGRVITDKDDNQIWGFYYGACALLPIFPSTKKSTCDEFWIVAATHENPFTKTLNHVIDNNLPYLFDPGMTLTWISDALLKKGVMGATYVAGNDYEVAMIEKRINMSTKELAKNGINVIITLGDKGVKYIGQSETFFVPAVKVKKVVDPTGAGDAWRGGFVGALGAHKSIKECLIMGNVMASFAVESVGTVEYEIKTSEVRKRIRSITSV